MRNNKKYITIFLCVFLILIFSNVISYADTITNPQIPADLNTAIVKSSSSIKGMLKTDMVNYGLSSSDDIDRKLTFDKGYRYYEISMDAVNEYNKTLKNIALKTFFKDSNTYMIPLTVGGKSCGLLSFQFIDGEWKFFQLSNDLTFENDLEKTISKLETDSELNNGLKTDSIIIYDYLTDLTAIGVRCTTDEYVIPIRTSGHTNIAKNSILTVGDCEKIINTFYKNSLDASYSGKNGGSALGGSALGGSALGGSALAGSTLDSASTNDKQINSSTIIIIFSIVFVVLLASIFIFKKRLVKRK